MIITQHRDLAPRCTAGEPLTTVPNAVTLARTFGAVGIGAYAVASHSLVLLAIAYAVYWIGDIADGWLARRLDQETRTGAVLDIVSDRACMGLLCVGLLDHLPAIWPVEIVFLLSFMVLDTMLSLAFLCWPIASLNYFYLVDRRVWQLNWSPVAKATNTAGVVVAVALGAYAAAFVVAAAVVVVKVWSAARVSELLRGLRPAGGPS